MSVSSADVCIASAVCHNRVLDETTRPIFQSYMTLADSLPIASLSLGPSFVGDDLVTAATLDYLTRMYFSDASGNSIYGVSGAVPSSAYSKLMNTSNGLDGSSIGKQAKAKAQLQALINAIMADVCRRNQCGQPDDTAHWYWITIVVIIVVMLALIK